MRRQFSILVAALAVLGVSAAPATAAPHATFSTRDAAVSSNWAGLRGHRARHHLHRREGKLGAAVGELHRQDGDLCELLDRARRLERGRAGARAGRHVVGLPAERPGRQLRVVRDHPGAARDRPAHGLARRHHHRRRERHGIRRPRSSSPTRRPGRRGRARTPSSHLDLSSAEWIAEAPAQCSSIVAGRCTVLPLANFGSVLFSSAATTVTTPSVPTYTGTISDPTWSFTSISLGGGPERLGGHPVRPLGRRHVVLGLLARDRRYRRQEQDDGQAEGQGKAEAEGEAQAEAQAQAEVQGEGEDFEVRVARAFGTKSAQSRTSRRRSVAPCSHAR